MRYKNGGKHRVCLLIEPPLSGQRPPACCSSILTFYQASRGTVRKSAASAQTGANQLETLKGLHPMDYRTKVLELPPESCPQRVRGGERDDAFTVCDVPAASALPC